ncbi:MAG TPA: glycosyltransferase [Cellvibrio sp.]|nr:glycosyltransferase [Cellvibrio sp.]
MTDIHNIEYKDLPFISIIIPTLNEELFIEQTLNQLEWQDYPKELFEVFVVDGQSSDNTVKIVENWKEKYTLNITILFNTKRFSSCARNLGIRSAQGEYILFIDAHVFIPSNNLLRDMAFAARVKQAKVLGRPQPLTPPSLSNFQTIVAGVRTSRLGHSTESYIYSDYEGWVNPDSVAVMYHRSLFNEAGYFDEKFDAAEDVEFNFRLKIRGYQAYISPQFKVFYYPRADITGLIKQMFRYGVGRAKFTGKHSCNINAELFVPPLVFITFICTFLFLINRSSFLLLCISALLGYSALIVAFCKYFSRATHFLAAPALLFLIHFGLAAGLMKGFIDILYKGLDRHE